MNKMCKIKRGYKSFCFLILLSILISISGCHSLFEDGPEIEKNNEWRYYTYNPTTIISELDRGNRNVFEYIKSTATPNSLPSTGLILWNQSEYQKVVAALEQEAWQAPEGALSLYQMEFVTNCSDVERGGFRDASFYYFKIIETGEKEARVETIISILPERSLAWASKAEISPNIHKKEPIDISQYQISADAVLQIAEKNGGTEKRLAHGNQCKIHILAPNADGIIWTIIYLNLQNMSDMIYKAAIDSQTGAVNVLVPKQ